MTVFSKVKQEELLEELASAHGFDNVQDFLEQFAIDSICPGICPLCKCSTDVDSDTKKGPMYHNYHVWNDIGRNNLKEKEEKEEKGTTKCLYYLLWKNTLGKNM